MQIIEPLRQEKKLVNYLDDKVKKVATYFPHGAGDVIQFIVIFDKLKSLYSNIQFDLLIQKGLGQKVLIEEAIEVNNDEVKNKNEYDYIFIIHFPVETDPNLTKSELCCREEIGIEPVSGHKKLPKFKNKLIGVSFQNTALPEVLNCPENIAEKIWNEILEAEFIPFEITMEHCFHNPVNKRYPFITATARGCKPKLDNLISLIENCMGAICAVSGPLHIALSVIPDRVMFIKNKVPKERFTYLNIPSIDVNNYREGIVKEWLEKI